MMEEFFDLVLRGLMLLLLVVILLLISGAAFVMYRDIFAAPCTAQILKEVK